MSAVEVPGPMHLIFMGASGSGKSAAALAVQERLGWEHAEGDDFHPPENIAKLSQGIPLTDADRRGWLEVLAAILQRMSTREHFMPPSLLESQLDTLEPLEQDEAGMDADPALPLDRIAAQVLARLGLN